MFILVVLINLFVYFSMYHHFLKVFFFVSLINNRSYLFTLLMYDTLIFLPLRFHEIFINTNKENYVIHIFSVYFLLFPYPKFFLFFGISLSNLKKIGIDEKVICYHNISNLLWEKDVLCAWKRK